MIDTQTNNVTDPDCEAMTMDGGSRRRLPSPQEDRQILHADVTKPPTPPPLPAKFAKPLRSMKAMFEPPSVSHRAYEGAPIVAAHKSTSDRPFKPCHMFFYGSLMDSEVIQSILNLAEFPTTGLATITGFQIKMWGIYPALVPSTSGVVSGTVWKIDKEEHFKRLAAYETSTYDWVGCEATLDDGKVLSECRAFCWAGSPDSNELEEGQFDLQRYQKYFKSSVTRRRSPAF